MPLGGGWVCVVLPKRCLVAAFISSCLCQRLATWVAKKVDVSAIQDKVPLTSLSLYSITSLVFARRTKEDGRRRRVVDANRWCGTSDGLVLLLVYRGETQYLKARIGCLRRGWPLLATACYNSWNCLKVPKGQCGEMQRFDEAHTRPSSSFVFLWTHPTPFLPFSEVISGDESPVVDTDVVKTQELLR
eukprot:4233837-Amphidinium_carterae.1